MLEIFFLKKFAVYCGYDMTVKKVQTQQKKRKEKMPGSTRLIITPDVKQQIVDIIDERIKNAHITKEDFSELKAIVGQLAQAQKQTEMRLDRLAEKVESLAEAQKQTDVRLNALTDSVKELTEAQRRTEEEVRKLSIGLQDTRVHLGGLSRSFSYAFENEAYRHLPKVLEEKYGYEIKEKMVRIEIGRKEINFFAKAIKDGNAIYIVGESKVRLDEGDWRSDVFEDLDEKINAVRAGYGDVSIQPILVTHFATKRFQNEAAKRGVIVIQSFEW